MNSQQRMDRAHEIFARVWPDDRDDTLYDVAEDVYQDLGDMADDVDRTLSLADDLADRLEDELEEADLREQIKAVRFWTEHMRKISERVKHALAVTDELERSA